MDSSATPPVVASSFITVVIASISLELRMMVPAVTLPASPASTAMIGMVTVPLASITASSVVLKSIEGWSLILTVENVEPVRISVPSGPVMVIFPVAYSAGFLARPVASAW